MIWFSERMTSRTTTNGHVNRRHGLANVAPRDVTTMQQPAIGKNVLRLAVNARSLNQATVARVPAQHLRRTDDRDRQLRRRLQSSTKFPPGKKPSVIWPSSLLTRIRPNVIGHVAAEAVAETAAAIVAVAVAAVEAEAAAAAAVAVAVVAGAAVAVAAVAGAEAEAVAVARVPAVVEDLAKIEAAGKIHLTNESCRQRVLNIRAHPSTSARTNSRTCDCVRLSRFCVAERSVLQK